MRAIVKKLQAYVVLLFVILFCQHSLYGATPVITSTAVTSATEGSLYSYELNATDADGDALIWSATSGTTLQSWLEFNQSSVAQVIASYTGFNAPEGLGYGGDTLYVADSLNNVIKEISSSGTISTYAGTGAASFTNGAKATATFSKPVDTVMDSSGNLYISDTGNAAIRKIASDGTVTTFAGGTFEGIMTDATGTDARFLFPTYMAIDSSDNIYVIDTFFLEAAVRKITSGAVVTTVINLTNNGISGANGIAIDDSGNIYISDGSAHKIYKIDSSSNVTTFAGSGVAGSSDGVGTAVTFNTPGGMAFDNNGNLYVADSSSNKIRKIGSNGTVTTFAGSGTAGTSDANGTSATFNNPVDIAFDENNTIYVLDKDSNRVRNVLLPYAYLQGTPAQSNEGSNDINLTVSDSTDTATQNFTITVTPLNYAPSIDTNFSNISINEDNGTTSYSIAVSDAANDSLTLTVESNNTALITVSQGWENNLSSATYASAQEFNLTTVSNAYGVAAITVTLNDGNRTATKEFNVTVSAVDDAPNFPTVSIDNVAEDSSAFTKTLDANDTEGDTITYSATSSNTAIATVSISGSTLTVTPQTNAYGSVTLTLTAITSEQNTTQTVEFVVEPLNDLPSFDTNLTDGISFDDNSTKNYDINISDLDGDDLNVTVVSSNTSLITVSQGWHNILLQGDYNNVALDYNLTAATGVEGSTTIVITLNDNVDTVTKIYNINVEKTRSSIPSDIKITSAITASEIVNNADGSTSLKFVKDGTSINFDYSENGDVSMELLNENVEMRAISDIPSETSINSDGTVATTATAESGSVCTTSVNISGELKHIVTTPENLTSQATFNYNKAKTTIRQDGSASSESYITSNGRLVTIRVVTDDNGETTSWYKIVSIDGTEEEVQMTVDPTTPMEAGNIVKTTEGSVSALSTTRATSENVFSIVARTKVTRPIKF